MSCYCDPDQVLQDGEHEEDCFERQQERDIESRLARERHMENEQ